MGRRPDQPDSCPITVGDDPATKGGHVYPKAGQHVPQPPGGAGHGNRRFFLFPTGLYIQSRRVSTGTPILWEIFWAKSGQAGLTRNGTYPNRPLPKGRISLAPKAKRNPPDRFKRGCTGMARLGQRKKVDPAGLFHAGAAGGRSSFN